MDFVTQRTKMRKRRLSAAELTLTNDSEDDFDSQNSSINITSNSLPAESMSTLETSLTHSLRIKVKDLVSELEIAHAEVCKLVTENSTLKETVNHQLKTIDLLKSVATNKHPLENSSHYSSDFPTNSSPFQSRLLKIKMTSPRMSPLHSDRIISKNYEITKQASKLSSDLDCTGSLNNWPQHQHKGTDMATIVSPAIIDQAHKYNSGKPDGIPFQSLPPETAPTYDRRRRNGCATKHEVPYVYIIGDEQVRDLALKLHHLKLNHSYAVSSIVKPYANSSQILNSRLFPLLRDDDIVVLAVGSNDDDALTLFNNLSTVLSQLQKKCVLVLNVDYNHNSIDTSFLNRNIEFLVNNYPKSKFVTINHRTNKDNLIDIHTKLNIEINFVQQSKVNTFACSCTQNKYSYLNSPAASTIVGNPSSQIQPRNNSASQENTGDKQLFFRKSK